MQISSCALADVLIIEPSVFADQRGHFLETWHQQRLRQAGLDIEFVQDNSSRSRPGVLRGLHYQLPQPQGKLVHVSRGRVWDVVVDLRRASATFARHFAIELNDSNHRQLWVPPGFAHGFYVLGDQQADVHYKCSAPYAPEHEQVLAWDDAQLAIPWPLAAAGQPLLSAKDSAGLALGDAPLF